MTGIYLPGCPTGDAQDGHPTAVLPSLTTVLPYLATVPHVDEGADGVEGACPAGQQVRPVVGVQHTDVVGAVGLGGWQGRGRVAGGSVLRPPPAPCLCLGPYDGG